MNATCKIPNVNLATIEKLRDEAARIEQRREQVLAELETTIVDAQANDARVSDIAQAAGMSRPKVYGILHRHGVGVDSDLGRRLVQNRWHQEQKPERDLFDPPAEDDPAGSAPEEEMSVLNFLAMYRAERHA